MKKFLPFISFIACCSSSTTSFAQQNLRSDGLESIEANYRTFTPRDKTKAELWAKHNSQNAQHPDAGKTFYFSPNKTSVEILEKRTEHSKYYFDAAEPSKVLQQQGYLPVHFKKGNDWVTIDPRIEALGKGNFEASNQIEPVGFETTKGIAYIKTVSNAKVNFNNWKLYGETAGATTLLAEPNWSNYTAGDDGLYITNIFPGIDAEMHTARGSIKTNFIVKTNTYSSFTNLIFQDNFSSDNELHLSFIKNNTNKRLASDVSITSAGNSIVSVKKALIYVQNKSSTFTNVAYDIDENKLGIVVPVSYIERYIKDGAIVVDPLVTGSATVLASTIGSRYNPSCTFSNSCDYTMTVATPLGVTYTDIYQTYAVAGYSPCDRGAGRWQVRTTSCTPGYVWLCTGTGPGACGGNLSDWGALSPCLPAPNCSVSTNIDFTLRMWRTCVGDTSTTDCNSTCWGSYWNWMMNIAGRTVEHKDNKITISTPKDSICSGTSVIFSKITRYGVAPYGVTNWSSSRTGTPSIGSGDSITRTFPAAGTYWTYAFTSDACTNVAIDSQRIYVDSVMSPIVTTPINYCQNISAASALSATKASASDTLYWYSLLVGGIGSTSAPTVATTTAGSVLNYVSERSPLGCNSKRSLITAYVNPVVPPFEIKTADSSLCLGESTKLSVGLASKDSLASPMVSPYAANQGIMFDVVAKKTITVNGFDVHLGVFTNDSIAIYYKPDTYVGFEFSPSAWTLLGTVTVTGTGSIANIPLPLNVTIPTGKRAAFYFASTSSSYIRYHYGTAVGTVVVEDANMQILEGANKAGLFSGGVSPRAFEGKIRYSAVTTLWSTAATTDTVTVSPSATTQYWAKITNTIGCNNTDSISVQVNPIPTAPVVTTPVVYCQGAGSVPLSATKLASTDTVLWYSAATGGTAGYFTPTPSTTTAGTTVYYVSLKTQFGCEGPRSAITVTINPAGGTPTIVTPVTYCQGATAVALSATKASSTDTLYWYTVATGGTGSLTAPTPLTSTVGSTIYYVSGKTSLGCEGARAALTVNINPTPAAPVVTTPVEYCLGATAVPLTATKPTSTDTLYWYTVATGGTGSITPPTPSTASAGSAGYYVSAKNTSKCEGPRSLLMVNINSLPAAPTVTTPVNLCVGGPSTALSATGASLRWYTSASGGIGSTTAPTPSTAVTGTTVYYVTQTNVGTTCESPRASISVVVNALPNAPVITTPVVYCQGASAVALTATKSTTTDTLYWYTAASGGTGTIVAPTPSTATVGNTNYYVSIKSIFGCEGNRSLIVVTINPAPSSPSVTSPVSYCKDATAIALSATKAFTTDTLKWYTAASGGTASLTAPTPSTTTAGTFFAYVSLKNNTACEGPRATITITINPLPATPAITTPLNLCIGGPSSALTATGTSLLWYTAATGGTGSSTAPTPATTATGTTIYYVTQTESVNLCESPRAALSVVVNPLPVAPTVVSPLNLCIGSTAIPLTATGTNLKWYSVATGGSSIPTPTPSTASLGSTNYYVSQTSAASSGSCEGPRATLTVAVQALPTVTITPVGVPGFFFCAGKTITLKANSATATTYQWLNGAALISGATKDTFSTGTTGFYKAQVTNTYGCKAETEVFVQKDTTTFPVLAPTASTICEEGSVLLYCHPGYTGFIFDWIKDGISMTPSTPKSNARPMTLPGIYKVTVTNIYNCVNTTNTGIVSIYPKPAKPTIVRFDPLLTLTGGIYTYYQWYRNGKQIVGANTDNYTFTMDGTYFAEITDANGCLNQSDTINVNGLSIGIVNTKHAEIKIFPNPTQNWVNIEAPIKINVRVTDIVGKTIWEGKNVTGVSLLNFASGTYLLRISDEKDQLITTEKITKTE